MPETRESLARLPSKTVSAGVLFFQGERLLVLDTADKPYCEIPGGIVERGESPSQAAAREVEEDLGFRPGALVLRSVDYSVRLDSGFETVNFVFDGGEISHEAFARLRPDGVEITGARLVAIEEALESVHPNIARRIESVLAARAAGSLRYFENAPPAPCRPSVPGPVPPST